MKKKFQRQRLYIPEETNMDYGRPVHNAQGSTLFSPRDSAFISRWTQKVSFSKILSGNIWQMTWKLKLLSKTSLCTIAWALSAESVLFLCPVILPLRAWVVFPTYCFAQKTALLETVEQSYLPYLDLLLIFASITMWMQCPLLLVINESW